MNAHFPVTNPAMRDPKQYMALVEASVRWREASAIALSEWSVRQPGPVIVAADLNATGTSRAYALMTRALADSWAESGFGFGHTYPATWERFAFRIPTGPRMLRLDYVFHSDELAARETRVVGWDGRSDHVAVVARLGRGR